MAYENFIAFRYLRSPRADRSISAITLISIVGVSIGVMALIVVLSVMNGFETDLRGALIGANSSLTVYKIDQQGRGMEDYPETMELIEKTIKVNGMAPFTMNQALLTAREKPKGTLVKGIDPLLEGKTSNFTQYLRTETYLQKQTDEEKHKSFNRAKTILANLSSRVIETVKQDGETRKIRVAGIIIGTQLAQSLGVMIGDLITMISPEERITPMGNLPRAKKFQVVGFFESGLGGYDEVLSFIDIKEAQKIFKMKNRATGISIAVPEPEKVEESKKKLRKELNYPFIIKTWIEENRNLFAVIQLEKLGLAVILTLIILVAAFNIISSLIMLVIEKRKDIAILKSMGAQDRSILKIFVIQGSIIGLMGTIFGELGGILLCWIIKSYDIIDIPPGVYVGNRIPMRIDNTQLILIALISFFICFLVTIIPSRRASKMDPVQNLRYE